MKINGLLQNHSCLITSAIDNGFIIPPPLPLEAAPQASAPHVHGFAPEADEVGGWTRLAGTSTSISGT